MAAMLGVGADGGECVPRTPAATAATVAVATTAARDVVADIVLCEGGCMRLVS